MDVIIKVPSGSGRAGVNGPADRNLKMIREGLGVRMTARDGTIRLTGDRKQLAAARLIFEKLTAAAEKDEHLDRQQVLELIARSLAQVDREIGSTHEEQSDPQRWSVAGSGPAWTDHLDVYAGGQSVRARTPNQQLYLDAIRDNDVVFGIGPAGTGKTYLAVAAAVHLLKAGRVKKVILARPAVEAGEKLGFLPGDLQAKVNPYLRPLFDALHDMMDFNTIKRFMLTDVVEVVPLAYMRGRTLNRAVIILDEAQNTTRGQMKMFLTRMGEGSKVIINGDTTQIDLPDPTESGLVDAVRVLRRVRGLDMITFGEADIVRHTMVQRIVEAYARVAPPPASASASFNRRPRQRTPDNPQAFAEINHTPIEPPTDSSL